MASLKSTFEKESAELRVIAMNSTLFRVSCPEPGHLWVLIQYLAGNMPI